MKRVMLLAIGAGLRKGEIDSLRWQQIDFNRQSLRLEISEHADLKTDEAADEVERGRERWINPT